MKISGHALNRYCERTGRDPLGSRSDLERQLAHARIIYDHRSLKPLGIKLARKPNRKDYYRLWVDAGTGERLCAVVRRERGTETVITVLCENMYGIPNKPCKVRTELKYRTEV